MAELMFRFYLLIFSVVVVLIFFYVRDVDVQSRLRCRLACDLTLSRTLVAPTQNEPIKDDDSCRLFVSSDGRNGAHGG